VWALVADVTRMGEWSPETRKAEWIDGATGPDVGARFKGHNQRGPVARWTTTCTVIESEPGRVFAFAVGDPTAPETVWRYSFVPAPDDATMVTETCEPQGPISLKYKLGHLFFGVTDREADLKRGIEKTLAKLQVAARAATL
jgi:hypothetical protein